MMLINIVRRFFVAALVFFGAGMLVSFLLSLVPDSALTLSFGERVQKNFFTFLTFDYGRTAKEYLPIGAVLLNRGLNSLTLIAGAVALVFLLGVPTGIGAALQRDNRILKIWTKLIYALSALPVLVWAAFLLLFVAKLLRLYPQYDELARQPGLASRLLIYGLPITALAFGDGMLADVVRVLREETTKVLEQDFVRALRARGLGLTRHVGRSLAITMIAVFTGKISLLLAGTIVVEYIFDWPGLGLQIMEAVSETGAKDYPFILAATMVFVGIIIFLNFLGEVAAIVSDPRLRRQ